MAVNKGFIPAMFNYALVLEKGDGIAANINKSLYLLSTSQKCNASVQYDARKW